jgi:hypothetical protein
MIETEDQGFVRLLRLARPPVNALDVELLASLDDALAAAAAGSVRAVVLAGWPGVFSAGLDVRELASGDDGRVGALVLKFGQVQQRLARSPIPVVAAITGHCPAGGAVMSMLCDRRIMAEGPFRIGLNEVAMGLYPGATVYRCFERLVGPRHAASLLATRWPWDWWTSWSSRSRSRRGRSGTPPRLRHCLPWPTGARAHWSAAIWFGCSTNPRKPSTACLGTVGSPTRHVLRRPGCCAVSPTGARRSRRFRRRPAERSRRPIRRRSGGG